MNASSEHVPQNDIYSLGDVNVKETYCYIISIAPVGPGNITIGFFRYTSTLLSVDAPPPGLFADYVILPIHVEIKDPANQTLVNKDIVTPCSFAVDFKTRGDYKVYLTNDGNKSSSIPIGVQFEEGNPQNREADKYLLAEILTASGAALTIISISMAVHFKRIPKIFTKQGDAAEPTHLQAMKQAAGPEGERW